MHFNKVNYIKVTCGLKMNELNEFLVFCIWDAYVGTIYGQSEENIF